jgi:methionyl aminopeptidase
MIKRNEPCWCGSNKKWKKCHYPKVRIKENDYFKKYDIIIKTPQQIVGIKQSCKLAAQILDKVCSKACEGVTTIELNDYAHQLHLDAGAIPAPLNYSSPPYPKSICTSINEVICHGIPDSTVLKDGDIVNIDVTCILNGYYGDCSRMVMIGNPSPEKKLVVETSHQCLMNAISILKPGIKISQIGDAIEDHAHAQNCSVVYQFVGHGVGVDFHEAPQIPHNSNNIHIELVPGMTFTIEPMINAGVPEAIIDENDKWTARTKDSKPSAQWEHTILITPSGHEILTVL